LKSSIFNHEWKEAEESASREEVKLRGQIGGCANWQRSFGSSFQKAGTG